MDRKLLGIVLILSLCSNSAFAETVGRVVAIVNGDVITQSDLDQAMASHLTHILRAPSRDSAFHSVRRQALERLIDERLMAQAMQRAKLEVMPDELDRALDAFLQQRKLTRAQLEQALRQQGIPMETFLKRVEDEVRQMKFVQQEVGRRVKISEQETEEYYRRHMAEFKQAGGRVRVAQILLPFAAGMDAGARQALRARAAALAREARQGDFAALAKTNSQGPEAAAGGELGVVEPTTLHPQVARAIARMQVGEVSDPIPSQTGYHILKLLDRGATSGADYQRLKEQIQQVIYQQKMAGAIEQYVRQLRQKSYVEIKG